jgi:hypothetical protein
MFGPTGPKLPPSRISQYNPLSLELHLNSIRPEHKPTLIHLHRMPPKDIILSSDRRILHNRMINPARPHRHSRKMRQKQSLQTLSIICPNRSYPALHRGGHCASAAFERARELGVADYDEGVVAVEEVETFSAEEAGGEEDGGLANEVLDGALGCGEFEGHGRVEEDGILGYLDP